MAQRPSRSLIQEARAHPLAFLSGLVGMSLNALGLWLLATGWGQSRVGADHSALVGAVGVLGFTFLLPLIWTALYHRCGQGSPIDGDEREDVSSARMVSEEMRPSVRVKRGAYVVWAALLLLGFAQLVLVISGDLDHAGGLALVGTVLNYVGFMGVFLVGRPLVRRRR